MPESPTFAQRIAQRRPELAARVLEQQTPDAAARLLSQWNAAVSARCLGCMIPREATMRLRLIPPECLARVLAELSPTTAAGLMRSLAQDVVDALLAGAPDTVTQPLRFLLRYPDGVVGAWMQADPLLLPQDADVAGALELTRASGAELDRQLFVVDRQQRLQGAVATAALLREEPATPLQRLLIPGLSPLPARTELHAALEHPAWERWDPLPVINRERRVVGLIHHADLRQAIRESLSASPRQAPLSGSVLELLELSWHGLADLLDGGLRMTRGQSPPTARRDG